MPGYTVINLRSSYRINPRVELFANVQNLFDGRYATFGMFRDPTGVGAPGVPTNGSLGDPDVDPQFLSPAMPRAYFGGVKISF